MRDDEKENSGSCKGGSARNSQLFRWGELKKAKIESAKHEVLVLKPGKGAKQFMRSERAGRQQPECGLLFRRFSPSKP